MRKCEQCGRTIRANSSKAIFLFLRDTPYGVKDVEVCGKKCLDDYNYGEDIHEDSIRSTV
jgi:hypothetical protein